MRIANARRFRERFAGASIAFGDDTFCVLGANGKSHRFNPFIEMFIMITKLYSFSNFIDLISVLSLILIVEGAPNSQGLLDATLAC